MPHPKRYGLYLLFPVLLLFGYGVANAATQVTASQQNGAVQWQVTASGYTIGNVTIQIKGPDQGPNGTVPAGCTDEPFVCQLQGGATQSFNTAGLAGGTYNWLVTVAPQLGDGSGCNDQASVREAQGGDQGLTGGGQTPEELYLACLRQAGALPPEDEVLTHTGNFTLAGTGLIVPTDPGGGGTGDNVAPVARCKNVTAVADANACTASADVNDGSSDPDGTIAGIVQDPAGPYGLGDTNVVLTVTDDKGATDSCSAVVTVVDETAPAVQCNTPGTIVPPDAPVSFTASGNDSCGAVTTTVSAYDCYKFTNKGKRVDKKDSCVVNLSGATATIGDSGGVGTFIEWTATTTDGSGNSSSALCKIEVVNPGKNK